jgi:hypothetical protein
MRVRLLSLLLCLPVLAQAAPPAPAVLPPCTAGAEPTVRGVTTPYKDAPRVFYLGDYITVHVCGLNAFLVEAEKQQQDVTLYLDGVNTKNPPVAVNREEQTLTFVADRNDANKDYWRLWLYNPLHEPQQELRVSVGRGGDRPLAREAPANMKVLLDKVYMDGFTWTLTCILVGVVIGVFLAGKYTDMLRDGPSMGPIRQTYSLARAQMAWWFVLILLAYVFVWLITGDRDTIPASLLGLMGISAVTAVAAIAFSPGTTSRAETLRAGLQADLVAIEASRERINAAIAQAATSPALAALLERKRKEQDQARDVLVARAASLTAVVPSRGFWRDLVSDDRGGVTLDRVQILVWTLVLGIIFVSSVTLELTMPEFSGTLLALMGISSGTYIGFKLPAAKNE